MTLNRYPKKLVENRDYVVVEQSVKMNWNGKVRSTPKIWQIWLIEDDIEAYICPTCLQVTSPTPRGILGHIKAHTGTARRHELASVRQSAAAFRLLPKKVQRTLLRRLAEQEKKDDSNHES